VREESGLAFGISAFSYTPGDPGILGVDAILDPQNREATQAVILQMIEDIRRDGITAEELAKGKKIVLSQELASLRTMRGQATDLGTNWFLTRNLNFSREYLDKIQKVTLDDINCVAVQYLTDENLTIVSLNPKGSLKSNPETAVPALIGEIRKFELSNGLRVLVREDARLPLIAISAVFRGGLLVETEGTSGITRLVAKSLLKGTKTRTAEQIANQLEAVGGEITAEGGNNSLVVNVDVTQPDLALGTDILADVLLNATMLPDAVAREKEIQLAKIKDEDEKPTAVARNLLKRTLFPNHPLALRSEGTPESVARLNSKELLAFRDRYIVARNGVVAVFGNVKAEQVLELLEQKLGPLPQGELALQSPPPSPYLKQTNVVEAEREKAQAVLVAGFRGTNVFDPDRYALELIDEASSDLASRFFIRIREQMGLAYFVFYLGTDPEKIESVKSAFLHEIHKLSTEGLSAIELTRAKKKLIGQQQIQNQSNDLFAYMTALDELYGLGFNHYRELESKVNEVTLDDIKRVAAKYFAKQPYVLGIVRPRTNAKVTAGRPANRAESKSK
jgi:zinc protease